MPYPRELNLDSDTEERLISWLEDELSRHYAERNSRIEDLLRYQNDYWATPQVKKATFPFTGAAIIIIPLSAIAIEATHARVMTTFWALPEIVSATSISDAWEVAEKPFERFFNNELQRQIKIRKPIGDCFLECTKFGSMIGKTGYMKKTKIAVRQVGDVEQTFEVVVSDGAVFDCVANARFLMPFHEMDPQTATWCGEEHSATPYELMQMERAGMFRPGTIISEDEMDPNRQSKLYQWIVNSSLGNSGFETGTRFDQNQRRLENMQPVWPEQIDWVEHWCGFNIDGDPSGMPKEIVVHYHRPSRTLMSVRYNWNEDLSRPYRTGVFFPIEHRWTGIGICKQNEQFQREVTTQHRQRLDNATLANMRMIKLSKLSGYGPKEPVFPGKIWFLDDMTHMDTVQMGDVYTSSFANEQSTLIYSQQRTGVNEVTLGMPQVGTPGTATSDLARIQEGNKKSDFIYQNFKDFTTDVYSDLAAVIQQFGPRKVAYYDTAAGGQLVRQFFEMPTELIRHGLIFDIRPSGQQQNRVLDRQNWVQIAQLLQQYFVGLVQLAEMTEDAQLMQAIVFKGMASATEAMRQILETYDVRNIDRIIVREIEEMVRNGLANTGAQPGGNGGAAATGAQSPLAQLEAMFAGIGGGGNGAANRILGP